MAITETTKGRIVSALRMLWMRSPERAAGYRLHNSTCRDCGVKRSAAKGREQKIHVHHKDGITNWDKIVEVIREQLLVSPEKLECLCPEFHKKEHK